MKENKRKLVERPRMRKRFRREDSKASMNKSASASKASMDTVSVGLDDIEQVLGWSVRYEKDKVVIATVLDGLELYFNPCTGREEDVTGMRHLVSVPDISILTVAEDIRRSIRPPELVDAEGRKRVKSDRSVYVCRPNRQEVQEEYGRLSSWVCGSCVMINSILCRQYKQGFVFIGTSYELRISISSSISSSSSSSGKMIQSEMFLQVSL